MSGNTIVRYWNPTDGYSHYFPFVPTGSEGLTHYYNSTTTGDGMGGSTTTTESVGYAPRVGPGTNYPFPKMPLDQVLRYYWRVVSGSMSEISLTVTQTVVPSEDVGGDTTNYEYDWDGSLTATPFSVNLNITNSVEAYSTSPLPYYLKYRTIGYPASEKIEDTPNLKDRSGGIPDLLTGMYTASMIAAQPFIGNPGLFPPLDTSDISYTVTPDPFPPVDGGDPPEEVTCQFGTISGVQIGTDFGTGDPIYWSLPRWTNALLLFHDGLPILRDRTDPSMYYLPAVLRNAGDGSNANLPSSINNGWFQTTSTAISDDGSSTVATTQANYAGGVLSLDGMETYLYLQALVPTQTENFYTDGTNDSTSIAGYSATIGGNLRYVTSDT